MDYSSHRIEYKMSVKLSTDPHLSGGSTIEKLRDDPVGLYGDPPEHGGPLSSLSEREDSRSKQIPSCTAPSQVFPSTEGARWNHDP